MKRTIISAAIVSALFLTFVGSALAHMDRANNHECQVINSDKSPITDQELGVGDYKDSN